MILSRLYYSQNEWYKLALFAKVISERGTQELKCKVIFLKPKKKPLFQNICVNFLIVFG